jgi:hypothetical protein
MSRSLTLDRDAEQPRPSEHVLRPRVEAPPAGTTYSFEDKVLYALFAVGIVGNIILQKIAWPLKAGGNVPVVMPLFIGALALAAVLVKPRFDPIRVGGFFLLFATASISAILLSPRYSVSSLMLFVTLCAPFIVSYETSRTNYRRCMDLLVTVMLVFVGITLAQHVLQLLLSYRAWPDLNRLLPEAWLIPDYNYLQPIVYGSRFMKPNGVAFLEVSLLSQYMALALGVELALFRRPTRMIALAAGLMLTLAGTGALLMLLTLPILLGRMRIRTGVAVIALLVVVCLIAFRLGWFDIVSSRMDEYKHNGSSANLRFILPFERMLEFLQDPHSLISGIGAGQIEKGRGFIWWPFTKATIEYGLVTGLIFYAFLIYSLFRNAVDRSVAFVLIVWYSFEGTLLTPFNPLTVVMLGTMLRVAPRSSRSSKSLRVKRDGEEAPSRPRPPTDDPEPPLRRTNATASAAMVDGDATGEALLEVIGTPDTGGRLIYAIGDLHGRVDLLDRLVEAIRADIATRDHGSNQKPMIVLLGDYIDRGPSSAQVIDRILALEADPTLEVHSILGNHEDAMLAFLDERSSGVSWGRHGGLTTLTSYGVPSPGPDAGADLWAQARQQLRAVVPPEHEAYLRRLEHYLVVGELIFVHAGLRAGVPLARQKLRDILYIREEFLDAPVDGGLTVVHGHTPSDTVYGAPGRVCVDTGAYATGVLTAARFDGGRLALIDVRVGGAAAR